MTIKQIKTHLQEARSKGWWIACFYWERKLAQILGDLEPEGSNYLASARNGLRRKQYEKARELGFDVKPTSPSTKKADSA